MRKPNAPDRPNASEIPPALPLPNVPHTSRLSYRWRVVHAMLRSCPPAAIPSPARLRGSALTRARTPRKSRKPSATHASAARLRGSALRAHDPQQNDVPPATIASTARSQAALLRASLPAPKHMANSRSCSFRLGLRLRLRSDVGHVMLVVKASGPRLMASLPVGPPQEVAQPCRQRPHVAHVAHGEMHS